MSVDPAAPQPPAPQPRMQFLVYNPDTGQILRCGTCRPSDIDLQARPGEAVIEGSADDEAQYIRDGALVDYPPCPGDWAAYDYAAHCWTDPRSPEMLAALARTEAQKAAREYLAETDWMVTRAAETGKPIPEDVLAKRAAARATLSA